LRFEFPLKPIIRTFSVSIPRQIQCSTVAPPFFAKGSFTPLATM
jgi:hypothetical protein